MSKFGLYYFGLMLAIAFYYVGNAVMAAAKLGELGKPFFFNDWIIYGALIVLVILELIDTFVRAGGQKE